MVLGYYLTRVRPSSFHCSSSEEEFGQLIENQGTSKLVVREF